MVKMSDIILDQAQHLELYYWMRLTRTFDEHMLALWKQGRGVGGAFSQRGHEAISVGAAYALAPDDVVAPMHRELGCNLVRGITPRRIFASLLGRATGVSAGRDANVHGMGDLDYGIIGFISHLPQSMPVALGAAMSFRYRDEPRVALTFTGDGASQRRTFPRGAEHGQRVRGAAGGHRGKQPIRVLHAAGAANEAHPPIEIVVCYEKLAQAGCCMRLPNVFQHVLHNSP
jgi:TPP-dependent pyruvate/acetoin dehydrogenase alpha subunit